MKSELLLPAGNYQMCLAAIHNGADAIYVGMPGFNARGRSHDHEFEELQEIIETCHLYGVKVHVAFNILIFENEITKALEALDQAIKLSPDAFIVQDIGMASLIRARYPQMVIHGSTQMSITNHEAINLLDDLNIQRFVLGRENSIDEIKLIKAKTNKELEVFVHGALCVAYSGQCFTSESLGGRSANRGQCAQSCRFNYDLYVDNEKKELAGLEYLVSPKDLCGIEEVPQLQEIGVESFKVEGRLKSAEYVATVASSYRKAINGNSDSLKTDIEDMSVAYSRGFYSGWLNGVAHQELVSGDYKSHRGHALGQIKDIKSNKIIIESETNLSNGDGVLILDKNNEEIGDKIYFCKLHQGRWTIELSPIFNLKKIKIGSDIYLNRKESIIKSTKKSIQDRDFKKRIPIIVKLLAKIDSALEVIVLDGTNTLSFTPDNKIEQASNRPVTQEDFFNTIKGLSHTAYELSALSLEGDTNIFLHSRDIKRVKQEIVERLNDMRIKNIPFTPLDMTRPDKPIVKTITDAKLNILLRTKSQLESLLSGMDDFSNVEYIILDYEFGKDYFSSVKLLKEKQVPVAIATTRILKPNEYHNFKLIERCEPDAILVRNLGALNYFMDYNFKLLSDFSLNVSNSYTYNYLASKGLSSICMSYDMNIDHLNSMLDNIDNSKTEITIHQYMPEFHMEHCVFAAFMSKGNSFKDCGKPCEKHEVHLKDMYGNRHEIKADQECRNTMFNATAQSTIKYLDDWKKVGVSLYRFEALHEEGADLLIKINTYLDLIRSRVSVNEAYSRLGKIESYGLGIGQLDKTKQYQDRKKKS